MNEVGVGKFWILDDADSGYLKLEGWKLRAEKLKVRAATRSGDSRNECRNSTSEEAGGLFLDCRLGGPNSNGCYDWSAGGEAAWEPHIRREPGLLSISVAANNDGSLASHAKGHNGSR